MNMQFTRFVVLAASLSPAVAGGQTTTKPAPAATKGTVMTAQATGTFDVKVTPLPTDEKVKGVTVGRFAIEKQWQGDIVGVSKGEMMSAGGEVKGSGGYVAVEPMTVSVKGKSGTFILMHHATMKNDGDFKMMINVIPDSGTGDLTGIAGTLTIIIEGKNHSYKFDYTLPAI